MSKFKIHLKINNKTYYIQDVNIKDGDKTALPVSTITWSLDKTEAQEFDKEVAVHMLQVLSVNGRDYRSSTC